MQAWVENLLRQKIVALDGERRRPYEWAGDVYRAIAFGDLFWPDVHRVRGLAFLALGDNADFDALHQAIDRAGRPGRADFSSEVRSRSVFEVADFFAEAEDPLDPDLDVAYDELAEVLRRAWTGRLSQVLPTSAFEVTVVPGTDMIGTAVAISQSRDDGVDPR